MEFKERFAPPARADDTPEPENLTRRLLDSGRETVNFLVGNPIPHENYESEARLYGGRIVMGKDGRMIFDTISNLANRVDIKGDYYLRHYDDNVIHRPWQFLMKHPRWFFRFLKHSPMRYRCKNPAELYQNAQELENQPKLSLK